ncbi:TetR/AcrR family transcriptional regulator [Massilia rubra]|uniref:TetR/AcrR family transcriptional regulator n=1 Tax=Massilia rubra TaxID=2607910 RepID=UPI001E536AF9|nr:TetR/AcrR family transcriptional regulator [Massilia rubra]
MNNSQSKKATARRLASRKTPSQPRSAHTVGVILEGAAHILEQHRLEGYTTNAIATRAGVSIGSLYQYFPTKDAVTIALIERELFNQVREASEALQGPDHRRAVRDLVELASRYQLRRPQLARAAKAAFECYLGTNLPVSRSSWNVRRAFMSATQAKRLISCELPAPPPISEEAKAHCTWRSRTNDAFAARSFMPASLM